MMIITDTVLKNSRKNSFHIDLTTFLRNNLLRENQYGLRERRSTSMAVMELVEEITSSVDRELFTVGIFVHLKHLF